MSDLAFVDRLGSARLHHLQVLVALADAGSIRNGAQMLNAPKSTVGSSIHQLEAYIDARLIQGTSSGIMLTDQGRILVPYARRIVTEASRAERALHATHRERRDIFSIAVTPWVTLTFLPEAVERFRERMPNVRFEFFEGLPALVYPGLRDGSIELSIGREMPGEKNPDISFRPLVSSSMAIVVRRGHPRADSRSLANLLDLEWLMALDAESEGQIPFRMFEQYGLPMPAVIHFGHSLTFSLALLPKTDMVGAFMWPLIEVSAARDNLRAVPIREHVNDTVIGLLTRSDVTMSPAANCFIECLIDTIRDSMSSSDPDTRRVMHTVELLI
ncbi:LysR family transcriptional regulator [Paraburkholderia sp. UCT2]|uniref:LysR family transcriptional regulator n=1 Tax=Paraburkholderia sp. UCT2 TaxID=2615208 RepID=UPI0016567DD0|nr:LysR family transcriptional regulator [Paraburkholderia sp. UCT2]MBC8730018.1 LysR family transcriptional regulator [Paraburkholderia sp. UCT2]